MKNRVKERLVKRIFDIISACLLLVISCPILLLIAFLLKLEGFIDPLLSGPVFYRETRISKGKKFNIYKYRTVKADILNLLRKNADRRSITEFTSSSDKHSFLTPVGTLLAQIYFDELPQLFNVIKGDMSLVGPRPHVPDHYKRDLKEGMVSAKYIKAGIMGLGQACKGNSAIKEVIARMATKHTVRKDRTAIFIDRLYFHKYLRSSGIELLFFDIWIMYRCLLVVLAAKGM